MKAMLVRTLAVAILGLTMTAPAMAQDYAAKAQNLIDTKLKALAADPEIVAAVKAQNEKHATLTQTDIDALDKRWKDGEAALIDGVLGNATSAKLKGIIESEGGLFTELFITDNKGLNVGQNDKTSDFWQGDEPKWQKPSKGENDITEVEMDESTQTYQMGISVPIMDGGTFIGALTAGVNAEMLE